jgi:hypothetical protein
MDSSLKTQAPLIKREFPRLMRVLNGEGGAREPFVSLLAEYQLTMEGIAAEAFQQQMALQQFVDDKVDLARVRRNAAYAELESLREKQSLRVRLPSLGGSPPDILQIESPGSIAPNHLPEGPSQRVEPHQPPAARKRLTSAESEVSRSAALVRARR